MRNVLAALILILLPLPAFTADYPARVVGVTDGDTLTVLKADKTQIKVRLHAVDAPETGQDFGSRAKQVASELAFGKDVTVREVDKDRYGRTVAEVILPDGLSLGRELISQGHAWNYTAYSRDPLLIAAEGQARATHLGLWSQPNSIPPWKWRKGEGVPVTSVVVGNRKSHVYHPPHCRAVGAMKPENRVEFQTAAEAEEKGYHRTRGCK